MDGISVSGTGLIRGQRNPVMGEASRVAMTSQEVIHVSLSKRRARKYFLVTERQWQYCPHMRKLAMTHTKLVSDHVEP